MPSLFLDSLGLTDTITREVGPPPKPKKNKAKKNKKTKNIDDDDDDSLWKDVIPEEPTKPTSDDEFLPILSSCGVACKGEEDEDGTLEITNRGTMVQTSTNETSNDESTLGSLASTDSDSDSDSDDSDSDDSDSTSSSSSSSSSGSSGRMMDDQSSLVLLCEHIKDEDEVSAYNTLDNSQTDESSFGETGSHTKHATPATSDNFVIIPPTIESGGGPIQDESRSHQGGQSTKAGSPRDESREGISASSSLGLEKEEEISPVRSSTKFGFSFRKQRSASATVTKGGKNKKHARKFLSFGKVPKNITYTTSNTVGQESTGPNMSPETATRQAQGKDYEPIVLLMETIVLKPDYRGRLIERSNLEDLLRSIDPTDGRHCVLGVANGFEVVRPASTIGTRE